MLVSNNSYRLAHALGSGTRPRLDGGQLGIAAIGTTGQSENSARTRKRGLEQWSSPTFEIASDRPVPAGIDGEANVLDPPLRFRIISGALRVRIAPSHPGASPSTLEPESPIETIRALTKFALGRTVNAPVAKSS